MKKWKNKEVSKGPEVGFHVSRSVELKELRVGDLFSAEVGVVIDLLFIFSC
jgi:hypothetical protein